MESNVRQALVDISEDRQCFSFQGFPVRVLGYGHARAHICIVIADTNATIGTAEWDTVLAVYMAQQGTFTENDIARDIPLPGEQWLPLEGEYRGKIGQVKRVEGDRCLLEIKTSIVVPLTDLAFVQRR